MAYCDEFNSHTVSVMVRTKSARYETHNATSAKIFAKKCNFSNYITKKVAESEYFESFFLNRIHKR